MDVADDVRSRSPAAKWRGDVSHKPYIVLLQAVMKHHHREEKLGDSQRVNTN